IDPASHDRFKGHTAMSPVSTTHADAHHDDHGHHPTGILRYLYSTNHKDIGTMYLVFAVVAGCIGDLFSVFMRYELMEPGIQWTSMFGTDAQPDQQYWNVVITAHA